MPKARPLTKSDFEALSEFRYQLRRFLRFSEEAAQAEGLTPLQYQLLLHIKGFPGRHWATAHGRQRASGTPYRSGGAASVCVDGADSGAPADDRG